MLNLHVEVKAVRSDWYVCSGIINGKRVNGYASNRALAIADAYSDYEVITRISRKYDKPLR